ncbi:MAG: hypothetical protein HZA01_10895 [Nitrospinae bacterium]|nr:hypothetical protein [Nitrospinota bacterium]
MKAGLLLSERRVIAENTFVEMAVWRLSSPLPGSRRGFKYRLALVVNGSCVLRCDNEAGKGDHKHEGSEETPYAFNSPEALLGDFWKDVDKWRH